MRIDIVTPQDLVEIAALVNSAYRGESSRSGWTTEADYFNGERTNPDSLASELAVNSDRIMLAMRPPESSKIIGCVYLEKIHLAIGLACYLGMLTVDPTIQAHGLGRRLLGAAEAHAKNWGATYMTLGVLNPRLQLMDWYMRRGYRNTGQTKPFPYGENSERDKPIRDDLHFVIFEKRL